MLSSRFAPVTASQAPMFVHENSAMNWPRMKASTMKPERSFSARPMSSGTSALRRITPAAIPYASAGPKNARKTSVTTELSSGDVGR
jgi:hypothetical protein